MDQKDCYERFPSATGENNQPRTGFVVNDDMLDSSFLIVPKFNVCGHFDAEPALFLIALEVVLLDQWNALLDQLLGCFEVVPFDLVPVHHYNLSLFFLSFFLVVVVDHEIEMRSAYVLHFDLPYLLNKLAPYYFSYLIVSH